MIFLIWRKKNRRTLNRFFLMSYWKAFLLPIVLLTFGNSVIFANYKIFKKDGKEGLKTTEGKIIVPAHYEKLGWSDGSTEVVEDKYLGYKKNSRWGILEIENPEVPDPVYYSLYPIFDDLFIAAKPNNQSETTFGLINIKGKEYIPFTYNFLEPTDKYLIATKWINGKQVKGLVDKKGKILLSFKYESIHSISENKYILSEDGNSYYCYNLELGKPTSAAFDKIETLNQHILVGVHDGKKGILNIDGTALSEFIYTSIEFDGSNITFKESNSIHILGYDNKEKKVLLNDRLIPIPNDSNYIAASGDQWQLLNNDFNPANKIWYDSILFSDNKAYLILKKNNKYGLADKSLSLSSKFNFDNIESGGKYFVGAKKSGNKNTYIILNERLIPINSEKYDSVEINKLGGFIVSKNGKKGYLDKNGNKITEIKYADGDHFIGDLARVKYQDTFGVINREGEWALMPYYSSLYRVDDNTFIFTKKQQYGVYNLIDGIQFETGNKLSIHKAGIIEESSEKVKDLYKLNGRRLFPYSFNKIQTINDSLFYIFSEKYGRFLLNSKSEQYKKLNKEIKEFGGFRDGFFSVNIGGQWGYIDEEERLRISNRYDTVGLFSQNMAPVRILNRWGFINLLEKIVIQPAYETVIPVNNHIMVKRLGKWGLIDRKGNEIIPCEYDEISELPNKDHYQVKRGSLYGIINSEGNQLLFPKFQKIIALDNNSYKVMKRNKWGIYDEDGMNIIPDLYDELYYDKQNGQYVGMTLGKEKKESITKYQ
ncbi:WG repeat-containing protein [Marinigracilibium pacificum]|uniref:WG repeat-containing protein n=1 Tax=Marinigracilibium pacificum TaxID=2729599 RepID=A0A848IZM0_9BACT|nr:WG repeat-containing protein [Marinigracilibium pacificum]NMM48831.1 WG repeat-containing protein [Marinigracilibium pacificum]